MKRPIRIEGAVAIIPLTKGYEAVIDIEDLALVDGKNWCAHVDRNTVYAARKEGAGGKRVTVKMHRILMGNPPGLEVDHKDGNGLNNRRRGEAGNLRTASRSQNAMNRPANRNNRSKIKGVCWDTERGKWLASIKVNGVSRNLGRFIEKTDAETAVKKARAELHGAFANNGTQGASDHAKKPKR